MLPSSLRPSLFSISLTIGLLIEHGLFARLLVPSGCGKSTLLNLLAGSIAAFAASEPTTSLAELHGARQLATLDGLGNNYPRLMLANNRLLERHPEQVRSVCAAGQPGSEQRISAGAGCYRPATGPAADQ